MRNKVYLMLLAAAVAGIVSAGNAISPRSGAHAPEVCCDKPGTWSFETSSVVDSGRTVFTVRMKSPTPATPPEFDVFFTESGADVHNVWVPFYGESERNRLYCVEWGSVRYTSELGQNYPIACAFNEAGESVLAVAASECLRLVRYGVTCHSTDALLEGRFRFFSRPEAPRTDYEVKILVDRRRGVFFGDAIAAATRWVEQTAGLRPCRVPEAAFDPLYSSWYAFWQDVHDQELEEEARKAAARSVLNAIFGVVQYSMRLATIPPWQKEAIRHWIAFSQAHRETLLKGKFRPYSPELMYPLIEAEGEGERIFAVYSPGQSVKLPADKTAYVLNATKAGEIVLRMGKPPKSVEVFDTFGERMGTPPCGFSAGEAALALPVPASGYARIEW